MLVPMANSRTVRRFWPNRLRSAQLINPSMPPEACVRVMIPPISAEKTSVLALPGLVIAARKVFTPSTNPTTGFHEFMMVQPNQTKMASEM